MVRSNSTGKSFTVTLAKISFEKMFKTLAMNTNSMRRPIAERILQCYAPLKRALCTAFPLIYSNFFGLADAQ